MRCLEKDPARRFHDVGELAIALYSFAPRRARISAERCCYVLKNAGLSDAEFELPSMNPPSIPGSESETNIPLAPSVMRSSPTAPVVAPQPSRVEQPAPSSGGSRWAFVALAAAVAAGGYAFWVHRSVASVQAVEAAQAPAAAAAAAPVAPTVNAPPPAVPAAAAPAPAPAPAAVVEPQPGATGSAAASAVGAKGAAAKARPVPPPRAKAPAAPAPTRPSNGGRDELDVGF
jgi:hypothetical protein